MIGMNGMLDGGWWIRAYSLCPIDPWKSTEQHEWPPNDNWISNSHYGNPLL